MSLKTLVHVLRKPPSLKAKLDIYLEAREDDFREPGWHPSDFAGMCARHRVLSQLLNPPQASGSGVTARLRKIWDLGHGMHDQYQAYFGEMGVLWGSWECRCERVEWGFKPDKDRPCPVCLRRNKWTYKEPALCLPMPEYKTQIIGATDGILMVENFWMTLELKSINDRGFKTTDAPQDGHVKQVRLYTELIRRGLLRGVPPDVRLPQPAGHLIMYMGKNTSEEKEFFIPHDSEAASEDLLQPFLVEKSLKEEVLPPKRVSCTAPDSKGARDCEVCKQCFSSLTWEQLKLTGAIKCKIAK